MVRKIDLVDDQEVLLALLNSTPVTGGVGLDLLSRGASEGPQIAQRLGGKGSTAEVEHLREVRDLLQSSVRTGEVDTRLLGTLDGIVKRPASLTAEVGLQWELDGTPERLPAARLVIAWAELVKSRPGRLRACENDECQLFLIDHSKGNTARWCSMATCGNRMKARRHHSRKAGRTTPGNSPSR
jgi:predicted RNA-binding Zn ribbon-like protein